MQRFRVVAGNDVSPGNASREEEAAKSGFGYVQNLQVQSRLLFDFAY
jgi:hypothetical protein